MLTREILESYAMRDWVYLGRASVEIADLLAALDINPDMPHTIRRYATFQGMWLLLK
jgi:hypothetical protein